MKLTKQKAINEVRSMVLTQCLDSFEAVQHLEVTGHSCEVPWIEVIVEVDRELYPVVEEPKAQVINLQGWVKNNRSSDKIPTRLSNHLNRFTA